MDELFITPQLIVDWLIDASWVVIASDSTDSCQDLYTLQDSSQSAQVYIVQLVPTFSVS